MNSKIVGFILSKKKIDYKPLLNANLNIFQIQLSFSNLSLYYYGNIEDCKTGLNQYSMGFPAHNSLLDHNLLITIEDQVVIVESDWLGSIPCFYNEQQKIVSSFPKVCLENDKTFSTEGLQNYLSYGFSVFNLTAFNAVKFLSFNSCLSYTPNSISIKEKEDPLLNIDEFSGASEDEIWSDIRNYSQDKEQKVEGNILIPTSAGYDSRIINYFINDHSRVKNYSYGISGNQSKSFEVIEAKKYALKLGHSWEQIHLKDAFNRIDDWHDLYSFSTHLHGMYHIEFYSKLLELNKGAPVSMVSGICGGIFTGSNQYSLITKPEDIYQLAFTHGLNYKLDKPKSFNLEREYMDKYQTQFVDTKFYPVMTMRIKLMLLSYLLNVPSVMGIPAWTPFLNFEIVLKMLNLPSERRMDRRWVKEFFLKKNLVPNKNMFLHDTTNKLNYNLHKNSYYNPIDNNIIIPGVNQLNIASVNDNLQNISVMDSIFYNITSTRVIKELLAYIGVKNSFNIYLSRYQTIKAIDKIL